MPSLSSASIRRWMSSSSATMLKGNDKVLSDLIKDGLPLVTSTSQNVYANTGKWILGTAGLVVGMVHIGGITRLTQSGLSMTDWSITGGLPPLNEQEWLAEFERYKQYPEYQQRQSMTLSEFQYIYAWEYGHRMFGRLIGLAFVGPWMYYSVRKRIPVGYQPRMALLGTMGLTQGLVGWWMVKSGLGDDRRNDKKEIRVTPFRLTTHLSMAVATYGTLLWTAFDILKLPHTTSTEKLKSSMNTSSSSSSTAIKEAFHRTKQFRTASIAITGLTAVTIVSGALVAGNDAGRAYNTFPKMGDEWIPSEIYYLTPWYRNFIENTATVQFNHRILGSTVACSALALATIGLRKSSPSNALLLTPQVRKGLYAIAITATGQAALGITTLLTYVPISLAALHQMGSLAVFTSGIYLVHSLKYAAVKSSTAVVVKKTVEPVLKTALRHS